MKNFEDWDIILFILKSCWELDIIDFIYIYWLFFDYRMFIYNNSVFLIFN